MTKIKIKVSKHEDDSELIKELEDLLEKSSEKPLCFKSGHSPYHDSDGEFSSKEDATSWSVRTVDSSKTDCKKGQRRMNPSRWTSISCGRKDAKNPNIKAKYKCKDGSKVKEILDKTGPNQDYKDCVLQDLDKKYKSDEKTGEEHIEVDKKLKCKPKPVPFNQALNQDIETIRAYEDSFDDEGRVCVARSVFKKYLQFIQAKPKPKKAEVPLKEKDKHGRLDRNEYRDSIMPGWSAFKSLAAGIAESKKGKD